MDIPNQTFIIAAAFHPARSLLGRWIRALSIDDRQAESTYVVAAGLSVLVVLFLHLFGWSVFPPSGSGATVAFVAAETVLVLGYVAAAFAGRDSAISVYAGSGALQLSRPEGDALSVAYADIETVCRIDSRAYHRHYRRYAETRSFVNRTYHELLLLRWNGVPVVIGLRADDLQAVECFLTSRVAVGHASCSVDAM